MKNNKQDQLFAQLLQNDRIGEPDKAIEDRLNYSFLLKNSASKAQQNSFAGFLGWLFSLQGWGMKTAMVSLALFFSVVNQHLSYEPGKTAANDSLFIQRVLVADSAHLILPIDSIRNDSLN